MLETIATLALGGAMTAFAVFAVMLNEGERSARLRKVRGSGKDSPSAEGEERQGETAAPLFVAPGVLPDEGPVPAGVGAGSEGQRRLPVGDFLFGALSLKGTVPLAFSELARSAGESGLDVSQVLDWLARAEEGGLIERVYDAPGEGELSAHPAVRLTAAGMDLARNNRRGADRGAPPVYVDDALHRTR